MQLYTVINYGNSFLRNLHPDPPYLLSSAGLNLSADARNISKKAVYLRLSEPNDPCSVKNIASAFHMMSIHVHDRAALSRYLVDLGSTDSSAAMDFVNSDDARSRSEGCIGSALVVLLLGEADVLPLPLRVKKRHLPRSRIEGWENHVRLMIDQGQPYIHDEYLTKLQLREDRRQNRKASKKK